MFKNRLVLFLVLICLFSSCKGTQPPVRNQDWISGWVVKDDFSLQVDSSGFDLPTSMAFVPKPGSGAKDPLYFVTELRGTVKVVTNDRSVHEFARIPFNLRAERELPETSAEFGLAGICLDPANGYVFVTFAYQDANEVLYNNIIRFDSVPDTFGLKPQTSVSFADVFSGYEAAVSHQIGTCRVVGNHLYVGVGDAARHYYAQRTDSILGKVLRMTLDGKPAPENPFYIDDDARKAQNFIFAYGFRNPFALFANANDVYVADNGQRVDRFLHVEEGQNYGWNGSDQSITSFSNGVFLPSIGPVQMDYVEKSPAGFPDDFNDRFLIATSGVDRGSGTSIGVLGFRYGNDQHRMITVPEWFVRYQSDAPQNVAALATGPDGIYFAPILPLENNRSSVLKLTYTPGRKNKVREDEITAEALIEQKGCLNCHALNDSRESIGPSLRGSTLVPRLKARLSSPEYRKSMEELDRVKKEPYINYVSARNEVLQTNDMEQVRVWIKHHLLEPKFDNPRSQMPNLQLTESEAIKIADFLIGPEEDNSVVRKAEAFLTVVFWKWRYKYVMNFIAGFCAATALFAVLWLGRKFRERNRT